jgi:cellobiose phosphorylase
MKEQLGEYQFIGEQGQFEVQAADKSSYLYFPLVNEAGIMGAVTPNLHGDLKTGQDTFALEPVSAIDLHNKKSARNFWFQIEGEGAWSATGNSAQQNADKFADSNPEATIVQAGMLWHKVIRTNSKLNLKAETTNFIPPTEDAVELMKVTIINQSSEPREITPISAIPIYGRSADNLRDHRHVTSLLHRIKTVEQGVEVKPTLSFDERGHKENNVCYKVLGRAGDGTDPVDFCPVFEDFIGEGGSLEWPKAVVNNSAEFYKPGTEIEGFEAVGALRFESEVLEPGEEKSYILAIAIDEDNQLPSVAEKYCSTEKFNHYLQQNKKFWEQKVDRVNFYSGDEDFNQWLKWVTLQPVLRRIFGCSFLPHHDYGRGGRGWRDLWQDCLALLLVEPEKVRDLLINNFSGVRIDGSNATIIGDEPGEFIADRNDISRSWMDHGAWPWVTTKLYLDQSGDLDFLLEETSYFRDAQLCRAQKLDEDWKPEDGKKLLDFAGTVYQGTVIEHLLVQHLSIFYNVGLHNNLRLEGGDWNDGLDMAAKRGESVAFTALYGNNLLEMADILRKLMEKKDIKKLKLARELMLLMDTLEGKIDYDSVIEKQHVLANYFSVCERGISGNKVEVSIEEIISDLERKGSWIKEHIRNKEWIETEAGDGWFNGYYDNQTNQVEGEHPNGIRMTLTGQVFNIMGEIATEEQTEEIIQAANKHLKDDSVGGYRLNTNFKEVKMDLGRAFGFAFGHKENGAVFSHMAMMYSNALYTQGYAEAGYEVINSLYEHCRDFSTSRIYPGIPEYINQRGRGMYHYLTGSASWLLMTMVTQVYGVRGEVGDLVLEPKLMPTQFNDQDETEITTIFAQKKIKVTYQNPDLLKPGEWEIKQVKLNGDIIEGKLKGAKAIFNRDKIEKLSGDEQHNLEVVLGGISLSS